MTVKLSIRNAGKRYGDLDALLGCMFDVAPNTIVSIVDCCVHYVDVMCQLAGAKPVRVRGIGAALWAKVDKQNYGHLHVTFDDGSVGWYEAGWGSMMSDSADIDKHTKTDAIRVHYADVGEDKNFTRKDDVFSMEDEPGHQELCDREQALFLRAITQDLDLSASMDAAVNSPRIVLAAEQSIAQERVIRLDQA